MAILSISEAARTWRMGRTTIQRAIREGRLSAAIQPHGGKGVDTSELIRVFGEPCSDAGSGASPNPAMRGDAGTSSQRDTPPAVAAMQAHIEWLEAQLAEARERELWFRRQLEDAQRLLPAPTPTPQPAPRRPWILLGLLLAALALAGWWWRAVIVAALAA